MSTTGGQQDQLNILVPLTRFDCPAALLPVRFKASVGAVEYFELTELSEAEWRSSRHGPEPLQGEDARRCLRATAHGVRPEEDDVFAELINDDLAAVLGAMMFAFPQCRLVAPRARISRGGGTRSSPLLLPWDGAGRITLDETTKQVALSMWDAASNDVRLRASLRRLAYARLRLRGGDRIVDLVMALESLCLDETDELRYRLSLRVAAFAEQFQLENGDTIEGRQLVDVVREVFDARSGNAHGGDVKGSEKKKAKPFRVKRVPGVTSLDGLARVADGLLSQCLERARHEGLPTDWDEFVLRRRYECAACKSAGRATPLRSSD